MSGWLGGWLGGDAEKDKEKEGDDGAKKDGGGGEKKEDGGGGGWFSSATSWITGGPPDEDNEVMVLSEKEKKEKENYADGRDLEKEWVSFAEQTGEWEFKKITLWGVAWSFISQLSVGQELTKVSLPVIFFRPYSMLEPFAKRNMSHLDVLYAMNEGADVERMMGVMRWYLSNVKNEANQFEKKPFNPVFGETHRVWTRGVRGKETSFSTCLLEQVSHHPPISAIVITNTAHNVSLLGNYQFQVKFHANSLDITTAGHLSVYLGNHRERYVFSKGLPDMLIKRVVFGGRRQTLWQGTITLRCAKTKLIGVVEFYVVGEATGKVRGYIARMNDAGEASGAPLYAYDGVVGEALRGGEPDGDAAGGDDAPKFKDEKLLLDVREHDKAHLCYPGRADTDELSSQKVWEAVNLAIVADDLELADTEKCRVENAQRALRREDKLPKLRYFTTTKLDDGTELWVPKHLKHMDDVAHPPNLFPVPSEDDKYLANGSNAGGSAGGSGDSEKEKDKN